MGKPLSDNKKSRQELLLELHRLRRELGTDSGPRPDVRSSPEAQELDHLRKINRIYNVIQPGGYLDTTINATIQEIRDILNVDQVLLVHPCLAVHGALRVPFSCAREGIPLPYAPDEEIVVDQEVAAVHRLVLQSSGPMVTGPNGSHSLPRLVSQDFGARAAMVMALHPNEGDPWLLAVHQCSFERVWTEEDVRLFQDIARIMAGILRGLLLARSLEDNKKRLQNLSAQLFRAGEEERKKFAREIHDDLGQPLVAIKVGLDNALYDLSSDTHNGLRRWLVSAAGLAKSLVDRVRMMQDAMYPAALQDFGPLLALDAFINNYEKIYPGLEVNKVIMVQEKDIPESLGAILFRIVQEALYNAAKHSGGDTVSVALEKRDSRLRLAVRDNGRGFDLDSAAPVPGSLTGLGLPSMRERAEITGGAFSIHSAPGKGTFIQIEWPLPQDGTVPA